MTWFITHKPAYDTDFIELSKELQKRATQAHAELEEDPVTPRGNTIKPLKGWQNLWRYRFGDYRLIYSADPERRVVQLLAIGPRSAIYRRFNYVEPTAAEEELVFSSELAAGLVPQEHIPEWVKHPEWYRPEEEPRDSVLPNKLTPSRLRRWLVAGLNDRDARLGFRVVCSAPG